MVVTLTEKKTLQEFIVQVENMDSITVANAIIEVFKNRPGSIIKTLTLDNGFEFARHDLVTKELG